MSISEPFIRRPVATTLLMFGLMLAGLTGYRALPVAALPQVDYPTIVVATQLPGASAETMASAVTTPLERQFGQMPSLAQMTSVSSFGSSQITLQFTLDRDIDAAQQDVQAAINAASNLLPRTLPAPPTYSKSNPADQAILTLSATSDTLPLAEVDDFADSVLAQMISQVSGVGLVTIGGGQKPAVRVQVDPVALAGSGLTIEDVRLAIAAANVNQPKGNLDGSRQDWALATNDQLANAASFKPLIIAYKNGAPLRLSEIAGVVDGVENAQLAGWAGVAAPRNRTADEAPPLRRAIIVNIQRQPGANIIEVTDAIKKLLPQLRASMPQAIDVEIIADRTETVRASVRDVQITLVLTILLVVGVIYLFLGSLRATVIPGVAVPLSLIGTFGVMKLWGFSLDNLSLMALTISTGFVVDDAIVMIENVSRFIEHGEPPFAAALKGAKQIGFTIVSLTVSLVAVLIPLLFMGGLVGRLFNEFAVTLAIAIVISAVLSLTLTAMMCAWILKPHAEQHPGRLARAFERGFNGLGRFYDRTLKVVLRHQRTTLLVTLATLAVTVGLAFHVPKGFFPVEDTGMIAGITEAAPDVSFQTMMGLQERAAQAVLGDPEVATVSSFIGADGTNPTQNSGRLSIALMPRNQRDADVTEVIARLQTRLAHVQGLTVYLQPVQDLTVDARIARTQYQYTIEDPDPSELAAWAPHMLDAMRGLPELRDVASDQQTAGLELHVAVDRDSASRLGVTAQALDDTLYDAFGQRIVSTTFTQLNQYRIILELRPEDRESADSLDRIYVRSTAGAAIPLSAFARLETRNIALAIDHEGQFPSVTLSFNTAPGVSLGEAIAAIDTAADRLDRPPAMRSAFQGAAAVFRESLASEPILILAALITVYIVLGVLYESYIHPITILSTLPSAGVGAILALELTGKPFDVISLIGIVLLIGIVKKNAIMMIDFALEAEREQQLTPEESIYQACLLRFRPIMMTTMAALLGGLPLALGQGTGAELRRPLGITIVGGLLVSQVLTLYTTPVIYLMMERISRRFTRKRAPEAAPGRETEAVSGEGA
ncbi:MAG: multidrug efflux RND transporter permease subunit [Deltaproteobacteria bacterium]|nr:MAG: multidrug efflux RND transporter permease subunit [Deltaproteobacteria bacterium]